ncbi:Mu-like prophage FluMu protein gp41 [Serratia marcescens]|nr:Mu-like prophage FluMu protein gp41 [Serratia marcescens]
MAKMTVTLTHGLVTGKGSPDEATHREVELRELNTQDVVESQLASERVVIGENGKAVAYCSEVMMGLEMLRRQIAAIGSIPGPLSLKQIYQLHPEDLKLLTERADDMDGLLTEVGQRGRADAAGDGAH